MGSFCERYDVADEEYFNLKTISNMEKTFSVGHYETGERVIEGVFKTGTYGTGADHIDTESDEFTANARGRLDSVILPYYFLLALPSRSTHRALLILQKIGNKGTKIPLEEVLKDYLEPKKGYVSFDPQITEELFSQIENADRLLELSFEKTMKAKAAHDEVADKFQDGGSIKHKLVYGHARGSSLQLVKEKLKETLFNQEKDGIKIGGQEYNDGSLTVNVDGSQRSFALFQEEADMERILNPEQDNLDMNDQNHPKPESLSVTAREFANEILGKGGEPKIPEDTLLG